MVGGEAGRDLGDEVVLWLGSGLTGVAAAQTPAEKQYAAPADEIPVLEARVEEQEASLQGRIGEISAVGAELEAQSRADSARARASDLGEQTSSLERELASRRETFEAATTGCQEKARAAYKGGDLQGLSSLLSG